MKTKTYFQQLVTSLKVNKFYLLPYLIVWLMGLLVVLLYDKIDIHQFTNQRPCGIGDSLFPYITKLGETFPFIVEEFYSYFIYAKLFLYCQFRWLVQLWYIL